MAAERLAATGQDLARLDALRPPVATAEDEDRMRRPLDYHGDEATGSAARAVLDKIQ